MSEGRKRGRPRPEGTIARDEVIFERLNDQGPQNRVDLAGWLGVNANIVYLSVTRLRKAGRVKTVRNGKRHLWSVV